MTKTIIARGGGKSKVIIINEPQKNGYIYSKGMEEDTGNNKSIQF